jgi:hypothetical protein
MRKTRVAFQIALFWACAALVASWALDRTPPLKVLSVSVAPGARSGAADMVTRVAVDGQKNCSVQFSRALIDSQGFRWDLGTGKKSTREAAAQIARDHAGELRNRIPIPAAAAPGRATLQQHFEYVCNPAHLIWPIVVTAEIPVEVTQ